MGNHYVRRFDLSKYSLKSFDSANEFCCDTNASDAFTLDKNGTVVQLYDSVTAVASARTVKYATLALTGAAVHAAAVGIVNPEAVDVLVTAVYLDLTTHATAASGSIDIGWTSSSITTASDTLADGLLVGSGVTAPITYTGNNQVGANGKFVTHWTNATWITVSDDGTADVTGMVAKLYIAYILA